MFEEQQNTRFYFHLMVTMSQFYLPFQKHSSFFLTNGCDYEQTKTQEESETNKLRATWNTLKIYLSGLQWGYDKSKKYALQVSTFPLVLHPKSHVLHPKPHVMSYIQNHMSYIQNHLSYIQNHLSRHQDEWNCCALNLQCLFYNTKTII